MRAARHKAKHHKVKAKPKPKIKKIAKKKHGRMPSNKSKISKIKKLIKLALSGKK
jgi:hypothetical protein